MNIKVADAKMSTTNIKGRTVGQDFNDLVASIKEKGVLVPVLARKIHKAGGAQDYYEIIAGNRRFAAAKEAGISEIPAQIVEMTDAEAHEAQIVENLQRKDIHPLEEGELYRKLIEDTKYEIVAIAAKVGKAESYVKQRLFLTNLITPAADAYRAQKINDGHAVLIAKLSSGDQTKALQAAIDRWRGTVTVKELKEWIEKNIYSTLDNQPWLKSPEAMEAVGKCQECEPNKESLFGPVKEGACTSVKCWTRKMGKYIDYIAKTEKRVKVSSEYGQAAKGLKNKGDYVLVAAKGKDRCESVHGAIVAQGTNIGEKIDICSDKECKIHGRSQSEYTMTPAEANKRKEERKKEIAKAKKAKEDRTKRLTDALAKLKWPMSEKHLDALLALSLDQASSNLYRAVAKRHELEVEKQKNTWGSTTWNYKGAVEKMVKGLDNVGKLRMAFELLIDTGYDSLRNGIGKI